MVFAHVKVSAHVKVLACVMELARIVVTFGTITECRRHEARSRASQNSHGGRPHPEARVQLIECVIPIKSIHHSSFVLLSSEKETLQGWLDATKRAQWTLGQGSLCWGSGEKNIFRINPPSCQSAFNPWKQGGIFGVILHCLWSSTCGLSFYDVWCMQWADSIEPYVNGKNNFENEKSSRNTTFQSMWWL